VGITQRQQNSADSECEMGDSSASACYIGARNTRDGTVSAVAIVGIAVIIEVNKVNNMNTGRASTGGQALSQKEKKLLRETLMGTGTERDFRRHLREFGFKPPLARPWVSTTLVIGVALLVLLTASLPPVFGEVGLVLQQVSGPAVATAVAALGAFILGLQQWRDARHEISLDKYYDRLDLTNRRLDDWSAARTLVPPFRQDEWEATDPEETRLQYQLQMYAFLELDNLEYAIQKYKLGFMTPTVAHRSLRTFLSRCMRKRFSLLVEELAGSITKTENNPSGYDQHTRQVVSIACRIAKALATGQAEERLPTSAP
jgi:hypothetical protein